MNTSNPSFTLTRSFRAPKELVFDAFATQEALARWWGPVEAPIDVISLDFRQGGSFHYKMKGQQINYGLFRYLAIKRPDSMSWINSFANENGEIIKPPFEGIDVPKEMLVKIVLSEKDGVTTLFLESEPVNATDSEISTFISMKDSMTQGFGGTMSQLESYLAAVQA